MTIRFDRAPQFVAAQDMTSNRPLEDWGKLIGDVPAATTILDRFLKDAELIRITGKSYRLCGRASDTSED